MRITVLFAIVMGLPQTGNVASKSELRIEYRYDNSTGKSGGFFKDGANALTPGQHLLVFGLIFTFDASSSH